MQLNQIQLGIINYLDNELVAKTSGLNKFVLGAGSVYMSGRLEALIVPYLESDYAKTLGIIDDAGEINIEELLTACKLSIRNMGSLDYMGFTFTELDIDLLYDYIVKAKDNLPT